MADFSFTGKILEEKKSFATTEREALVIKLFDTLKVTKIIWRRKKKIHI